MVLVVKITSFPSRQIWTFLSVGLKEFCGMLSEYVLISETKKRRADGCSAELPLRDFAFATLKSLFYLILRVKLVPLKVLKRVKMTAY